MGDRRRKKLWRTALVLLPLAALAAGCGTGVTAPPTFVGGSGAMLEGAAASRDGGLMTAWFEYGPTTAYGMRTPDQLVDVPQPGTQQPFEAMVDGLEEGTTYHYRACTVDAEGAGICGADTTFTTVAGLDTVTGIGVTWELPQFGAVAGGRIDARSGPSGEDPEGTVTNAQGYHYFRWPDTGPPTCLRVEGDEAVAAFVSPDPGSGFGDIPILVRVVDGGDTGDEWGQRRLDVPLDTCPAPADSGITTAPLIRGAFVVHDHVAP